MFISSKLSRRHLREKFNNKFHNLNPVAEGDAERHDQHTINDEKLKAELKQKKGHAKQGQCVDNFHFYCLLVLSLTRNTRIFLLLLFLNVSSQWLCHFMPILESLLSGFKHDRIRLHNFLQYKFPFLLPFQQELCSRSEIPARLQEC